MIVSRQLYEDSIEKIFSLHLNENTEAMTHQYEQQNLCPYHREKYRRHKNDKIHRNKLNHHHSDKYVCKKKDLFIRIDRIILFLLQLHSRKIIILFVCVYLTSTTRCIYLFPL